MGVIFVSSILATLTYFIKQIIVFVSYVKNNAFPQPLSKEDEQKYLQLMQEGDAEARDKLIEHNLRLVAHIVKKFENTREDTEDLISIGTIGLIKAIESYSGGKGTKLATYAARCIENEILMSKEEHRTISPAHKFRAYGRVILCSFVLLRGTIRRKLVQIVITI